MTEMPPPKARFLIQKSSFLDNGVVREVRVRAIRPTLYSSALLVVQLTVTSQIFKQKRNEFPYFPNFGTNKTFY
jgi:hypothetical protein